MLEFEETGAQSHFLNTFNLLRPDIWQFKKKKNMFHDPNVSWSKHFLVGCPLYGCTDADKLEKAALKCGGGSSTRAEREQLKAGGVGAGSGHCPHVRGIASKLSGPGWDQASLLRGKSGPLPQHLKLQMPQDKTNANVKTLHNKLKQTKNLIWIKMRFWVSLMPSDQGVFRNSLLFFFMSLFLPPDFPASVRGGQVSKWSPYRVGFQPDSPANLERVSNINKHQTDAFHQASHHNPGLAWVCVTRVTGCVPTTKLFLIADLDI